MLQITIVDVNTCNVVPNAAVDLWHCDATGLYSHYYVQNNYADPNSTFLRGSQFTDSNGVAEILSIFPAFYTGRATHIHFKVHINGTTVDGGKSKTRKLSDTLSLQRRLCDTHRTTLF